MCASAMFCRDNKDGRGYELSGDGRMSGLSSICYAPIRPIWCDLLHLRSDAVEERKQNSDVGAESTVFCGTEVHLQRMEC